MEGGKGGVRGRGVEENGKRRGGEGRGLGLGLEERRETEGKGRQNEDREGGKRNEKKV